MNLDSDLLERRLIELTQSVDELRRQIERMIFHMVNP